MAHIFSFTHLQPNKDDALDNQGNKIHTRYHIFNQRRGIINNTVGQEFWQVMMKMLSTVMYMAITTAVYVGRRKSTFIWSVDACRSWNEK